MIYCATEELEIKTGTCCSSVFLGLHLGDFEIANLAARHAIAAFPKENPRLTCSRHDGGKVGAVRDIFCSCFGFLLLVGFVANRVAELKGEVPTTVSTFVEMLVEVVWISQSIWWFLGVRKLDLQSGQQWRCCKINRRLTVHPWALY